MGTLFLSSKECSGEAHTSEYIYDYVDACIQEVGAEHVVQIVTDNASNNMGAASLLKVTRPKIFWTSCVTHTINLMLEGIGALPSLSEKKEQLRHMFSSTEWEECRFYGTVKGKAAYATVLILRMVDADWKPSMGFVYRKMIKAKEEIKGVLGGNKKAYEPIIKIIEKKMKGRLDTVLHLMAYLLNPYYFYKDTKIQHDPDVSDAVHEYFETILAGDANIHTKKRNRLEASKLNNLVYVQFNSNLMKKAKRRKARDVEVLLSNDSNMAQEWIVECDGDGNRNGDEEVEVQDQQDQEAHWEVIGEAMEANEYLQPR
ncbi:ribonuclease H-like domain-containing protein [Tanacetum coccineum]